MPISLMLMLPLLLALQPLTQKRKSICFHRHLLCFLLFFLQDTRQPNAMPHKRSIDDLLHQVERLSGLPVVRLNICYSSYSSLRQKRTN